MGWVCDLWRGAVRGESSGSNPWWGPSERGALPPRQRGTPVKGSVGEGRGKTRRRRSWGREEDKAHKTFKAHACLVQHVPSFLPPVHRANAMHLPQLMPPARDQLPKLTRRRGGVGAPSCMRGKYAAHARTGTNASMWSSGWDGGRGGRSMAGQPPTPTTLALSDRAMTHAFADVRGAAAAEKVLADLVHAYTRVYGVEASGEGRRRHLTRHPSSSSSSPTQGEIRRNAA